MVDVRTTEGRTLEHRYTIISPFEPDGSGDLNVNEPRREKTGILHMRKQRHRSASR